MAFQLVQILYWLALSIWFGGAMFVVMTSRVIFKTVQENNPILPHVLSVNLEGQHGTLLAGTIMGNILASFLRVEVGCWIVLVIALGGEMLLLDLHDPALLTSTLLRGGLLLAAGGVVLYDWRLVWPRLWKFRQEFLDHADEPEIANPAKDQFDRYQKESVMLLEILLFLLLGMVLFSGGAAMHQTTTPIIPATQHGSASSQPELPHGIDTVQAA